MRGDLDLDAAFDDADDEYDNDNTTTAGADASTDTSTGYGAAAQAYWTAGWRSILPMRRGKKFPPPTGYTGDGARVPSYADIATWAEDHGDGNLALVMPDGVIGIDVDAYGSKRGGDTLAAAEAAWGALPLTVRSTSRTDGASGIRLFTAPPEWRSQGQLTMDGHSDVEIIQRHHRYVVAYPSIHPAGGQYRWLDADGNEVCIPRVEDLPPLPDRWVAELTAASVPSTAGVAVDVPELLRAVPGGDMDAAVATRLDEALADLRGSGSRHDAAVRHVLALLRCAEQGHSGVRGALDVLCTGFVDAVTDDGTRDVASARAEFARMLTNERGHALIAATPTLDFDELAEVAEAAALPPPPSPPSPPAPAMSDDDFWSSRKSLSHIRDAAHRRMAAPWGVLGVVMARAICTIPRTVTLPPLIGGPGSLNTFIAAVGRSGDGKGASSGPARELVPHGPEIGAVEVGSGEGLAHQYVRRPTPSELAAESDLIDSRGMVRIRESVLFTAGEVDTLAAVGARSSATLMPKLRNAYSGEELGFGYANPEKALLVGPHGYRMGLVVGVQPRRAAALLDDADGGTPQRFAWVRVTDPTIRRRPRGASTAITPLALPMDWPVDPWTMPVPEVAEDAVLDAHVARQRGEGDALDGHSLFTRLKVMASLAVIDGRIAPNDEDWALAGHVMAHSDAVRAEVAAELATAEREHAAERGAVTGVERDAAAGSAYATQLDRVCGVILRGVGRLEAAGKPVTDRTIGHMIAGRDRPMKPDALAALILHRALIRDPATGTFALPEGGEAAAG